MLIGLISGTGTEQWPGISDERPENRRTRYGSVDLTYGCVGGVDVVHLSRHGPRHERISNHVDHRANIAGLKEAGAEALISLTVCGAVDATIPLSSTVVFDDLYFPSNRLPDGSLCTFHDTPGALGRGHWIFDRPFSGPIYHVLVAAAHDLGLPVVVGGSYGYVDGPRFNTGAEIAALRSVGVAAVSQTAGPEAVLAGEAELPFALVGFVTDYANGVVSEPQTVDDLRSRVAESTKALTSLVERALPAMIGLELEPAGVVYHFDQ